MHEEKETKGSERGSERDRERKREGEGRGKYGERGERRERREGEGELCRKFISSNIPRNYFIVFPNLSNQMRGDYRTRDVTKMFFILRKSQLR